MHCMVHNIDKIPTQVIDRSSKDRYRFITVLVWMQACVNRKDLSYKKSIRH